jgi:integrase
MSRLTCSLLKPTERTPFYRLRYRQAGEHRWRTKSLGVRNRDVAERRRLEFIANWEREDCGILPPKAQREAAVIDLNVLVKEYVADLEARKCAAKHIEKTRRQILKPAEFCGWRTIAMVTSADFIRWRSANGESSPKTLNLYLDSLSGFFTWLRQTERASANPLAHVSKINGKRDIRRKRRALTDEEAKRLLCAAPEWRREVYFLALWTGLRRDELKNLTWGDVHLDAEPPRILPRAETTKNGKSEPIVIHPELAGELLRMKGAGKQSNARVVRMFSRMEPMKADLERAGIPFENAQGRADFHALRHTFNARMAAHGVPQKFAQRAMRHNDSRLTSIQYLDPTLSTIAKSVEGLPGLLKGSSVSHIVSHIVSHNFGASGHSVSQPDKSVQNPPSSQDSDREEDSRDLAPSGAPSQRWENGSSGRIRTYDLVVNSHPLYR